MGWIMDGLESDTYDRIYGDAALLRRVLTYFRPHWRQMTAVVLAVALDSGVSAGVPILISQGIDMVARVGSAAVVWVPALVVIAFSSLSWIFNFLRQNTGARVVGNVVLKLREDAFAAVTQRDLSFYDEQPSGKIVSRVASDTQDFSDVVTLVMGLLSQVVQVVVLLAVLFSINAHLSLIMLAMLPVVFALALSFRRIARSVTRKARRVLALVNALIQESITGIAVAKNFRKEAAVYSDFRRLNRQAYGVSLIRGWVLNTVVPIIEMGTGVGIALIIYYGGTAALRQQVTPGQWYLFVQAFGWLMFPVTSIASFWSQFQDGLSAAERVFSLIDAEPKVVQQAKERVQWVDGRIEFRDLCFTYTGRETVLDKFSLVVPPGQKLAIVGHTGAGKSSLARLIERFYEFQEGQILIDGRDIRTLDLEQYRRFLGLVPQEPFLFSGTLGENIRYARPGATDDEVRRAAASIADGDWLLDLPGGLDTDVGERGARLSMGQRQLVALARVVLIDPRILILDEATASVDPFTESQIQEGLDAVMRGRTSIAIAHRLSTVRNVDRIIVLRKGQIIEEGTHDTLMARGGHYSELYSSYFRHQSLEYIEQACRLAEGGQ